MTPHHLSVNKFSVNIATRNIHSKLNRLVIARLPLALPPHASNPSTYITGLLHIAPVYITFESAWQSILDKPRLPSILTKRLDSCDPEDLLLDSKDVLVLQNTEVPPLKHTPKVCSRTHSLLSYLRLPGLLRAGRLRSDIRILTRTPDHKIDEQLEIVSQHGKLAAFIVHTQRSVDANPHVLLAYAWVLYMALFSGGRYLRALLQDAGGSGIDFWHRDPSPIRPYTVTGDRSDRRRSVSEDDGLAKAQAQSPSRPRSRSRSDSFVTGMPLPGMQFFNFMGDEDGEDIKLEFKKRIGEAEILLTQGEKEDVITEAQAIFEFMVEMVGELDQVMASKDISAQTAKISTPQIRSRDSLAVALERLSKKIRSPSDRLEKARGNLNWEGLVTCLPDEKTLDGEYTKEGTTPEITLSTNPVPMEDLDRSSFLPLSALMAVVPVLVILSGVLFWRLVY